MKIKNAIILTDEPLDLTDPETYEISGCTIFQQGKLSPEVFQQLVEDVSRLDVIARHAASLQQPEGDLSS